MCGAIPPQLAVQARHLVDRVQDESVRRRCPYLADVCVWGETAEGLESAREVVGEEGTADSPVDCWPQRLRLSVEQCRIVKRA